MPSRSLRLLAASLSSLLLFALQGTARASPADCAQIDASSAATILAVSSVRVNAIQGQHSKLPPDNMDLLTCGYFESALSPYKRSMVWSVYTPIASDLGTVFKSLSQGYNPGAQSFSPGIGQATGWYRGNATGDRFDGFLALLTSSTVVTIRVGSMPSSAAAETALITAAKKFSKP
jgi:hypothetical protein